MKLEQHLVTGNSYARNIWYLPGPADTPHPLCIFLDGEHYWRDMEALTALKELLTEPAIPPLSLLFVSHVAPGEGAPEYAARRTADYTCDERYAQFIAQDVVHWAVTRNRGTRTHGNVICGLSLSGLQSAYITLLYPTVFSSCLSQSGSFWWLEGRDLRLPAAQAKFWLSVGDQETATGVAHSKELFQKVSQIAGVEKTADELRGRGGTVHYHKYSGGHAPAPWREELAPALRWLLTT